MAPRYPFRNLVFQAGGVKTFSFHGVIQVLEEAGILPGIERVAGSSAGAMLAAILSFRLSAAETVTIFRSLDYASLPARRTHDPLSLPPVTPRTVEQELNRFLGNVETIGRLFRCFGWYSTEVAYRWIHDTIAALGGNGRATFADLQARGNRELFVVATNVSRHRLEILSAATTPNVAVVDALLMSQAVPLYFEAPRFDGQQLGDGDYYADGGIMDRYPLQLFDASEYVFDRRQLRLGVNYETLGCHLYRPPECPDPAYHRPITNLLTYVGNLLECVSEAHELDLATRRSDRERSIDISDCCVLSTDIQVQPQPDNPTYQKLVAAGSEATRDYLLRYRDPGVPTGIRGLIRRAMGRSRS